MKIAIIGTGNVATVLGKKIKASGHTVLQVIGRSESSTSLLASYLECPYSLDLKDLMQDADIYIISVQDKEIEIIIRQISIPEEKIIVHTAGGVSINLFAKRFKNYGIFYPLQSLRKEAILLPEIPLFIDANNEENINKLMDFAETISDKVALADDLQRMKLHVAGVFANNFTNYLYCLSNDFCAAEGIDFYFLKPLIEETTKRLQQFNPNEMQTGPAIRGDQPTMKKHLALLNNQKDAQDVYLFLSEKIQKHFKN